MLANAGGFGFGNGGYGYGNGGNHGTSPGIDSGHSAAVAGGGGGGGYQGGGGGSASSSDGMGGGGGGGGSSFANPDWLDRDSIVNFFTSSRACPPGDDSPGTCNGLVLLSWTAPAAAPSPAGQSPKHR